MEFGVFDHLDRGDLPLKGYYEERLKVIEAYDRGGFYSYHVAEHHSTPLGMAPSPSVFLASVAQRTRRLRFGPMVYALPFYHPLRLIEEICMLDQISGGRLEMGFGRGASPIELGLYGQNPADSQRIYEESLELILRGLSEKVLNFKGEFFSYDNVPMELQPLQKPHPPLWYGVHSPESAERAAQNGLHIMSLDTAHETRSFTDRYREVWQETHGGTQGMPKIGIGRFIVLAESDNEALSIARRAYLKWHRSFNHLYKARGGRPRHPRPPDFDSVMETGLGYAGTAKSVSAFLQSQLAESGSTYLVGQFAFGDLSLSETLLSIELFTRRVMPELNSS